MNNVIVILISMLFSAFFSGMEIAFVSSNKLKIELERKKGKFPARIISIFAKDPGQFIATMLVGNNIALVIYGLFMAILLEPFILGFTSSEFALLLIQTIISTFIILITAEFLPKTIFRVEPNLVLNIFSLPGIVFYVLLYPVTKFTIGLSEFIINKLLRAKGGEKNGIGAFTRVDLDHLVNEAKNDFSESFENEHELRIFQNALDFSKVKLRDCMVPRTEIEAVDEHASIEELKTRFIETGYSKILIFKESIDNIIGYITSKAIFNKPSNITSFLMPISVYPEAMPANKLLKQFIQEGRNIAIVVDEFGGTAGMVTIEDVIEEIFGEIEDEHDTEDWEEKKLGENEYILSGRLEIDYLNEKYKLNIPESEEYSTLAGYIFFHYENMPRVNEKIIIDIFTFKILKVSSTRLELVHLTKNENA